MPQQHTGGQRQRHGDVHQQPGHLFRRCRVDCQRGHRPGRQHDAKWLPPTQQPNHRRQAECQRHQLVHRQPHRVVVPGLVAPGDLLLRQPVAQALPRAGEHPGPVGENGRVQRQPYCIKDAGAPQPHAAAPGNARRRPGNEQQQQGQRRNQVVDGDASVGNVRPRFRRQLRDVGQAAPEQRQPQPGQQNGRADHQRNPPPGCPFNLQGGNSNPYQKDGDSPVHKGG